MHGPVLTLDGVAYLLVNRSADAESTPCTCRDLVGGCRHGTSHAWVAPRSHEASAFERPADSSVDELVAADVRNVSTRVVTM